MNGMTLWRWWFNKLRTATVVAALAVCAAGCGCDLFGPPNPPPSPSSARSDPADSKVPTPRAEGEEQAKITAPVILVPGILGSFPTNPDDIEEHAEIKDGMGWQLSEDAFANQYGALGRYKADVFVHLRQRLWAKGYRPNESLFAATYDWRRSIADSSALRRWLEYAISTFNLRTGGSASSVDVVAHSMGALLVRKYLQSSEYKGDIRAFAIVASPQFGAVDAYYTWAGGTVPPGADPAFAKLLSGLLERMNAKIRPQSGRPIRSFVREYVQSVRDLLPIPEKDHETDGYLFAWPGGSRTPFAKMRDDNRNKVVEQLNEQLKTAPLPGNVAIFLARGVDTLQEIKVAKSATPTLWEDGEPTSHRQEFNDGDGRVLLRHDLMGRLGKVFAVAASDHQRAVCVFTPDVFKFLGLPVVDADRCGYDRRPPKPLLAITFTTTTKAELVVRGPQGQEYTNEEIPILKTTRSRHLHVEEPPDGLYQVAVNGGPGEHFVFMTSAVGPFAESSIKRTFNFASSQQETWQVELKQGVLSRVPIDLVPRAGDQ